MRVMTLHQNTFITAYQLSNYTTRTESPLHDYGNTSHDSKIKHKAMENGCDDCGRLSITGTMACLY